MMRWPLVLGLMGAACMGEPETRFDVLRLDPAFSLEEAEQIVQAAADWCSVSSDTCVPVELNSERPNVHRVSDHSALFWGHLEWPPPTIRINVAFSKSIFRTMAHELGHSWRGDDRHMEGSGTLLSLHWFNEDSLDCIDAESAEFVCRKARCGSWQPGTC